MKYLYAALAFGAAVVSAPGPAPVTIPPAGCITTPATARYMDWIVLGMLKSADSARLASFGLSSLPTTTTLITNAAVCDSVAVAYNTQMAKIDSSRMLGSVLVIAAGATYWIPETASSSDTATFRSIHGFTSKYAYLGGLDIPE